MIAYLSVFHMVHCSFILDQGWLLSNHFCKACQQLFLSKFWFWYRIQCGLLLLCWKTSCQCHHAVQIPYSQKETPGLNKNLAKIWPNLHVNWMQLNLQLVEFVNLVRAFLSGCRVTPIWTKKCFDMFYEISCSAAIHDRIWMNNVPSEYLCYHACNKSVLLYLLSSLRNLESSPGFLFVLTHTV